MACRAGVLRDLLGDGLSIGLLVSGPGGCVTGWRRESRVGGDFPRSRGKAHLLSVSVLPDWLRLIADLLPASYVFEGDERGAVRAHVPH